MIPKRPVLARMVMSGFGLGYAPVASGTFGSAGAIAISLMAWGVWTTAGGSAMQLDAVWVVLMLLSCVACVGWGRWAVAFYSERAVKAGDPGQVVIDEFAGQWIALLAMPMTGHDHWTTALAIFAMQFFLFRVFDVLKLPPARQLEKFPAGWGILLDDIAAGVHANIVGQIFFRLVLA